MQVVRCCGGEVFWLAMPNEREPHCSLRGAAVSALVRLAMVQSAAYCLRLPLHMHRQLHILQHSN